jgi:hypothetical protein
MKEEDLGKKPRTRVLVDNLILFCNYPLQPAVIIFFLHTAVYIAFAYILHLLVYIFSLSLHPAGEQHNDH